MQTSNAKELELPWGTLSEVARRMNLSRQTIQTAWENERPDVVAMVEQVVKEWAENETAVKMAINRIAANISQL